MSLSKCLKKAGESIAREDKVAILAKAKELREGGAANADAARRAVTELLDGSRAALTKMQKDLGLAEPAFARKDKDERDLIIQHNLTAENLLHAERMGGIPVPSLAITKAEHPSTNFGEITLLGDHKMATPSKDMKVFGADIYSPRYPQITYKLDSSALKRLNEKLAPFRKPAEGTEYRAGNREIYGGVDKQDDLLSREDFKKWAAANGVEKDGYHQLRAAATQLLSDVGAGERIFQGFTNSGNRKYVEHTLDRVVSILKKELRGGEGFNYGAGSLRAKFTPQFKTLNSIRLSKDRLMTAGNFDKLKDEINKELLDLAYDMVPNGGFRSSETAMSILEDAPKMGLDRAAKDYGIELSDEIKQRAYAFMDKLRHLPTAYFEAKALRAMQLGEFKAAVVPHDTDPKVRAALEKNGVAVHEYKRGDDADREAVIAKASAETPDVRFSRKDDSHGFHTREIQVDGKWRPIEDSSGRLLARGDFRGQQNLWRFLGDSKAVDERGRPVLLFHGTNGDFSVFDRDRAGSNTPNSGMYGEAAGYFTASPEVASAYASGRDGVRDGANVMPVYVSVKNPLRVEAGSKLEARLEAIIGTNYDRPALLAKLGAKSVRVALQAMGYDGVIVSRENSTGDHLAKQFAEVVAFSPEQIKSAMGGVGTYDGSNPDIRFARKGTTTATANLPASAPLGTWERSKSVVSDLIDEGLTKSGVYKFTSPMSEGSTRAKAIAQNFANAERQARREWQRVQDVIAKDFPDKTVREKMWNAADEENEILSGRLAPSPSVGLASLTPRQRDVVEQLHAYGEELLQRAKDVGMFSGDGVPYWTPRMMVMLDANGEYTRPVEPGKKQTSGGDGRNVFTSSSNLKQRKYLTSAETEAAMQAKGGELVRDITTMPMAMQRLERAIAGRELINQVKDLGRATGTATVSNSMHEGFFTLDHPSFTRFQPRFEKDPATGKSVAMQDSHGNIILDRVPLYMSKEFEGPIKAILSNTDGTAYRAYMLLKSKAMSAIMFSPMIHNLVIMGRAVGYSTTGTLSLKLYRDGYKARQDDDLMREALAGGMVPMGHNNAGMIDVTDVARGIGREGGLGDPNESWIAHGAKFIIGAVNKDAGAAAKRFIDKAGTFWHGTLLWDRVGDLQVGIFKHAYESLQAKGFQPEVARVMAAHWANRYAGAVARENMGEYARKAANVMLFSRSFNIGNVGAVKDMLYGMPSGMRAKIEYEHGRAVADAAFTQARKKAWAGFIKDATLSLLALSLAQSAVDKLKKDKGWDEIFAGYAERAGEMGEEIKRHPFTPKSYSPWQLSPTHGHEPGKQDRVDFGEIPGAGGRHEYMRLPTGKVVEDTVNWMTRGDTFHSKMSPLAKAAWEVATNDKGFGVPVWDPTATGGAFVSDFSLNLIKHLAKAQTPWDTIVTVWDRLHNKTTEVENDKMVGNVTGFGFSQGHPQGPEAGIAAKVEDEVKARKAMAMEEVKRLLRYDDEEKARQKLEDAGLSPREVNAVIKRIENPREGMSPSQRRRFNQHSTEEDQRKMDRVTR